MNGVVINNLKRKKFYGYNDPEAENRYEDWWIEFPESELGKLAPFCREKVTARLEMEDGSVGEYNCPTTISIKNRRFIYDGRPCEIYGSIVIRTNEKGEEVCRANALFPIQD